MNVARLQDTSTGHLPNKEKGEKSMFKKLNKKGFTLAELLVVVAIIGVLVAVSIPIFTGQLRKARLATNQANARAAYAAASAALLDNTTNGSSEGKEGGTYQYSVSKAKLVPWNSNSSQVWKDSEDQTLRAGISTWGVTTEAGSTGNSVVLGNTVAETWVVSIDTSGVVSFTASAAAVG